MANIDSIELIQAERRLVYIKVKIPYSSTDGFMQPQQANNLGAWLAQHGYVKARDCRDYEKAQENDQKTGISGRLARART